MKKIFTSILLLAATATAWAVDGFQLQNKDGSVVYNDGDEITVGWEYMVPGATSGPRQWHAPVYIKTGFEGSYTVKIVTTSTMTQCCFGGGCEPVSGEYRKSAILKADVVENTQFEIMDLQSIVNFTDPQEATLSVASMGKVVTLNIKFVYAPQSSLASLTKVDANGVNINGRTVNYSLSTPTELTIFTISGQPAASHLLCGHGTLHLDTLPGGVYLYRAGKKTGKFIVR